MCRDFLSVNLQRLFDLYKRLLQLSRWPSITRDAIAWLGFTITSDDLGIVARPTPRALASIPRRMSCKTLQHYLGLFNWLCRDDRAVLNFCYSTVSRFQAEPHKIRCIPARVHRTLVYLARLFSSGKTLPLRSSPIVSKPGTIAIFVDAAAAHGGLGVVECNGSRVTAS